MAVHPATPKPKAMTIKSIQPTLVSTSHNLRTQSRTRGAQRWEFSMDWGVLTRNEAMALVAFGLSMRGQYEAFYLPLSVMGNRAGCAGNLTGTVSGNYGAGANTITLTGLTPNATIAKAGNFVQFSAHDKLYMLAADLVSNASGVATMAVAPYLLQPVATASTVKFDGIQVKVRYASDDRSANIQPGEFITYSADFVEAF